MADPSILAPEGIKAWLQSLQAQRLAKQGESTGVGDIGNILGFAKYPAADLLDRGLTLADQATRLTDGYDSGMIPTRTNMAQFLARVVMQARQNPYLNSHPSTAIADGYMATRYPIRYREGRVTYNTNPSDNHPDVSKGTTGYYDVDSSRTFIPVTPVTPTRDIVGTTAHETQHAVDMRRQPEMFDTYVQPTSRQTYLQYLAHPTEQRARTASDTASQGYDNFLQKTAQSYDDSRPFMVKVMDWLKKTPPTTEDEAYQRLLKYITKP